MIVFSCSKDIDEHFPGYLDIDGECEIQSVFTDEEAKHILVSDPIQKKLLAEFKPKKISSAQYEHKGIKIIMTIARFSNADDGYGYYSGLVRFAREKWHEDSAEIAYKSPYTAGVKGEYAAWIFSPTNPMNYFSFYPEEISKVLKRFSPDAEKSYHYRILPEENRVVNSAFYVRDRSVKGIPVNSGYAAVYQAGRERCEAYIEISSDEMGLMQRHKFIIDNFLKKRFEVKRLDFSAGGPGSGVYWRDGGVYNVLYRYRWVSIYMIDLPDLKYSRQLLRAMYNRMARIRSEVIPDKPRSVFREQD